MTETKVLWLEWNRETFRKAQMFDKPILLDISAVWCHWCHVMDQTTYSDSEVARLIDDKYVPVRVDRDRRPDIDKRYNMGGWPSTVFLTPEGKVLTGGTYIPPWQMAILLEHVSRMYQKNRGDLKAELKVSETEKPSSLEHDVDQEVFQSIIDSLTLETASRFDSVNGGFGDAPKFPHSEALRLMFLQHHLHGHKAAVSIVKKTLMAMGTGGIYDQEEGGFFRYSTTRDWSIPHYEKLCEDNAKLLITYLEAYQITGEKAFKDTAKGILSYVDGKLSDQENGGFYGSQDADEVYYKLNLKERQNRTPPKIDKTLFINWNAMMASTYLFASAVLEDPSYEKFALQTVDLLLNQACSPRNGMNHYLFEGENHIFGLLTDQVYMLRCLIDCYQVSSDRTFLDNANRLAEFMLSTLWDESGGFYDKPKEAEAFGALSLLDKPIEENSVAADTFLRLHHLTGKQTYFEAAKKTLEYFVSSYQQYGIMGAVYGLAIDMYLHPMEIRIVGSLKIAVTRRFRSEILKAYNPLKVVETLDPSLDSDRLNALGYPIVETPTAYVCFERKCISVEDPKKLAKLLEIGGKRDGNRNRA